MEKRMKEKLNYVINQMEKWASVAREQQKLSRDQKKQFFFLSRSNSLAESISLIKRTFYKELNEQSTLPLTEVKK